MFVGDHIAKVDDKGRLVFPAQLKVYAECKDPAKLCFVVRKNPYSDCLDMLTDKEWERLSEDVRARLDPEFDEEDDAFWREYTDNRSIVEPDEKMGRILISKNLLELIDVRKEVVFAGKDFKIEIWAKEHFKEKKLPAEKISEIRKRLRK
ncbi:MAG: hypothetical protein FWG54_06470 [Bacteroidetes bacterium]|nr:hypothetical protein [Bacteroidota bacterium]